MGVFDKENQEVVATSQTNKKSKKKFAYIQNSNEEKAETLEEFLQKPKKPNSKKPNSKRGRLKKGEEEKKVGVWVYLSKEQKSELEARAKKANLPLSLYIRIKLFGVE